LNSTHEQDVVIAKTSIEKLKFNYMTCIREFLVAQKSSHSNLEDKFLLLQESGNSYFNFIENFVGNSNLLGAHDNGHWIAGFAEDCYATLESLIGHFQLIRNYISKSNPNMLKSIEPSSTAYANMQRMVNKYLTKDKVSEIKEKLELENLPVYGFINYRVPIMDKKNLHHSPYPLN